MTFPSAIATSEYTPGRGRLFIVSNRLPYTAALDGGDVRLTRSSGGLASALREVHERSDATWVGWSGCTNGTSADRRRVAERLAEQRAIAVEMSSAEVEGYYRQYANGVLWPTLHDMDVVADGDRSGWSQYRAMNERFADAVAPRLAPGDRVWVHDYHLMLLPALLRARVPRARISFFMHTPVPRPSRLTELREWESLSAGLAGADVLGFHTQGYASNFVQALRGTSGRLGVDGDLWVGERRVRIAVHPIGTDARGFSAAGGDPDIVARAERIRAGSGGALFVGIDRLDYTKGIPERLLAFERLLDEEPDLRSRARLIQVGVPTREDASGYGALRNSVSELAARINARYRTPDWTPVEYLHGSVDRSTLIALYRAADVMLVTPLCDGMNLVAKEFVASRSDGDGVLVLSSRAGASVELWASLLVDPESQDSLVAGYRRALAISPAERRVRMRRLRTSVAANDVNRWASRSLAALATPRVAAGWSAIADAGRLPRATRYSPHVL